MMRGLHALAKEGKVKSLYDPKSLIYVSVLWVKHAEVQHSTQPPWLIMKTLAGIGKLLGFKI